MKPGEDPRGPLARHRQAECASLHQRARGARPCPSRRWRQARTRRTRHERDRSRRRLPRRGLHRRRYRPTSPTPLPGAARQDFDGVAMIRVAFPAFSDGRGLTLARHLRARRSGGRLRAGAIAGQYTMARAPASARSRFPTGLAACPPDSVRILPRRLARRNAEISVAASKTENSSLKRRMPVKAGPMAPNSFLY